MTARKTRARKPAADKRLNAVFEIVDAERCNLGRAISLLQCLTIALEHGEDFHSGPYYADVSEIAVELIAKSVDVLDHFNRPGGRSGISK